MKQAQILFRFLFLAIFAVASLVHTGNPQAAPIPWQSKVDAWVLETAQAGKTEFLIFLNEQADLNAAKYLPTKQEKGAFVYQQLTSVAKRTQKPILDLLDSRQVSYRPFWVANMVWARGDWALIQTLARRVEVAHIYGNPQLRTTLPKPVPPSEPTIQAPSVPSVIEWNINKVLAPQVWSAGYTGQGAVIAGQDTGYDWDHPALINKYRGWNGTTANHDYNWHDAIHSGGGVCGADSPVPCDDHGHGTHTMGTMVGDDGAGNQIGMAPGARWIGCRNMNVGVGTPATYTECFQWFLAPTRINGQDPRPDLAPDVISNSWTCPPSEGCNWDSLQNIVNNVRAAGIVVVVAAGNSGSSCGTVDDPPAIYASSFTVGATDSNDNIASFSSRGPADYTNLLKPDVSAPGVGVRSSIPGTGYGYASGTSMATPHVAGLVGLLISAQPNLRGKVDDIETLIKQTALARTTLSQSCGGVPGTQVPNNTYGWGRIDAWNAVQNVPHSFTISKEASTTLITPSLVYTYTLSITHLHSTGATNNVVLTDTLPLQTNFFSATIPYTLIGDTVRWEFASMAANQTRAVNLAVLPLLSATGEIVNQYYGVRSNDVLAILGTPLSLPVASYFYYFPWVWKAP